MKQTMRMMLMGLCAACCALILTSCSEAPQGYFPLESGLQWHYRVTMERSSGDSRETFWVRSLGAVGFGDNKQYVRHTSDGTDYFLVRDESGIYRVAKRTIVEDQPAKDPEPRYVLMYPLQVGTEWRALTHSYVLQRIQPFTELLTDGTNFNMAYSIESLDETVKVPAGQFDHCILVRGVANLEIYVDPVHGFTQIPMETREWYAEGVGLVKLERSETLETEVFSGGTLRFELTRFER